MLSRHLIAAISKLHIIALFCIFVDSKYFLGNDFFAIPCPGLQRIILLPLSRSSSISYKLNFVKWKGTFGVLFFCLQKFKFSAFVKISRGVKYSIVYMSFIKRNIAICNLDSLPSFWHKKNTENSILSKN